MWWIFWALVQGFVLHRLDLSWEIAFVDSFVSNILLGILALTALVLYKYYQPGNRNRVYRFIYAIGISILFSTLLRWVLEHLYPNNVSYLQFLERSMPLRTIMALVILSFITMLNWMWSILQEQQEREFRHNEAEQLVKDAELVKLRQQLQPHFLFNSLNSISALAGSKPEEARKMIQQLSDFLRGTLKKDEQKTVSLKEEIDHLKLYLEIEKVRFGHRLQVAIELQEAALTCTIPPLLLQPLLENAIKFGLYGTIEALTVSMNADTENGFLKIVIRNPFDEQTQSGRQGTGFGLSSIQRRLQLLYGRTDLLNTRKENSTFITTLEIPQ
ncbi:MAG: histidine kinase [bacterium]|nr:histidine kinase [bacterium]